MAYYEIPDNPEYSTEIRKLENSDPASAEKVFNPLFQTLINNTHYLHKNKADKDMSNVNEEAFIKLISTFNCGVFYVEATSGDATNLVINKPEIELKKGLTLAVKTGPFNYGYEVDNPTITFNRVTKNVFTLSGSRKLRPTIEHTVIFFTYSGNNWYMQDYGLVSANDLTFYKTLNGVSQFTDKGIKSAVQNAMWEYISIPAKDQANYPGGYKPFIYYEFEGALTMATVFVSKWDKTGPMPIYKFQFTCPDSQASNFDIPSTIIGAAEFKKKIQPGGTYVVTIMNNILTYHEILPEN